MQNVKYLILSNSDNLGKVISKVKLSKLELFYGIDIYKVNRLISKCYKELVEEKKIEYRVGLGYFIL